MIKGIGTSMITKLSTVLVAFALLAGCGTKTPPAYDQAPLELATVAIPAAASDVGAVEKVVYKNATIIKTNVEKAASAPTTQAAKPYLSNALAGVTPLFEAADLLTAIQTSLNNVTLQLADTQGQITAIQKQVSQLKSDLSDSKASAAKWENKYRDQWLGGKSWNMIYWISGIVAALTIADVALYFLCGVGLNPISLVIRLFGSLFQNKTLAGAAKPPRFVGLHV